MKYAFNKMSAVFCIAIGVILAASIAGCGRSKDQMLQKSSGSTSKQSAQADSSSKQQNGTSADEGSNTNKKLSAKLNQIAKVAGNMNDEIASLKARLYLEPEPGQVYDITPSPKLENGWYVVDQIPEIRLKGYKTAREVRFMAAVPEKPYKPVELGDDEHPSDGWNYRGPLIGKGETVVWAEITESDGGVIRTPLIPVRSELAADAAAIQPAKQYLKLVSPPAVVKKYYALTSQGDYQDAWDLIHPSERDHPASGARNIVRQQFWALQGTKGPNLGKIVNSRLLHSYKIYATQLQEQNVMALTLTLRNGKSKTIHLLQDSGNRWRLFWEPNRGLE